MTTRALANNVTRKQVPVLIVGGGPCGMLASVLLSRYRIPSLLVEKGPDTPMSHPRAHVLNARSMEILRKLKLETFVLNRAPPKEDWTSFRYCESVLNASDLAWMDHSRTKDHETIRDNSACRVTQISQPILEDILRKEAVGLSNSNPANEILFEHSVNEVDFRNKIVKIQGANGVKFEIEPQVVIAADGARSFIRESAGVPIRGRTFLESFVSVHFTSPQVAKFLRTKQKAAMLTFVFNPSVIAAVFVAHDARGDGSFVAHVPFFPPAETPEHFEDRSVLEPLISKLLDDQDKGVEFTIKSIRSWGMHATLAENLSSHDGWVALVGDAGHQFPPSGGFGVNLGLSEVDNLTYKLFSNGCTPEAVTMYAKERHPIAKESLKVALDNYERGLKPAQALGLERQAVSFLSSLANRLPFVSGSDVKSSLMRRIAQAPVNFVLDRPERVQALKRVVEVEKAALPLYFPKVDLGVDLDQRRLDDHFGTMKKGRLVRHAWFHAPSLGNNKMVSSMDLASPFFNIQGEVESEPIKTTAFIPVHHAHYFSSNNEKISKEEDEPIRLVIITTGNKDAGEEQILDELTKNNKRPFVVVEDKSKQFFANTWGILAVLVDGTGYIKRIIRRVGS